MRTLELIARGRVQLAQVVGAIVSQHVSLSQARRYSTGFMSGAYGGRKAIWMCPAKLSTYSRTNRLRCAFRSKLCQTGRIGRDAHAQMLGQRSGAPLGGVDRLVIQRDVHDTRLHRSGHYGEAPRAQRIDPPCQEGLAPQRNLSAIKTNPDSNVLVLQAICGK